MNSNDRKIEQDDFHRIKSFPEKVSGKEPGGRRQKGGTSRKNGGKRRNKAAERRGNGVMGCYCVYETVFLRFLAAINEPWLVRNSAAVVSSCLWVSCYLSTTLHKPGAQPLSIKIELIVERGVHLVCTRASAELRCHFFFVHPLRLRTNCQPQCTATTYQDVADNGTRCLSTVCPS